MNKLFLLITVILIASNVAASSSVNIKKYGAKADGKTLNTAAINTAIEACANQGGGTVVIPSGVYLTGTIHLKSHVSLYLEEGAVIKGTSDLDLYQSYDPVQKEAKYDSSYGRWNRALILGVGVENVAITGDGIIDGNHVFDSEGEENMRGPHTILMGESRNLILSNVIINRSANYAFMAYGIENAVFQNLTFNEGWDGIHIRGGKNININNSKFYTGDDAIAGGYWENMLISDCYVNSSCNGIRVIMPATNLTIARCTFEGPGKFSHRTSKELNRKNMLSAILLQPGGWSLAPGKMDNVHIHDINISNLDNPFMFILNRGNESNEILVERVKATGINKSACSIESWKGGSYGAVTFRDVSIEYVGHNDPELKNLTAGQPHVDSRVLPCWGWFVRNVRQLTFENVEIRYTGVEVRPAFCFDNVGEVTFKQVRYKNVPDTESIISQNSGEIKGTETMIAE